MKRKRENPAKMADRLLTPTAKLPMYIDDAENISAYSKSLNKYAIFIRLNALSKFFATVL